MHCYLFGRNLQNMLNTEEAVEYVLESANRLFVQNQYNLLEEFTNSCEQFYGAPAESVDFSHNTEAAKNLINDWVEGKTRDKITELLKPGVLNSMTRVVLVNAIYFKGTWMSQFKPEATRPDKFHVSASEFVDAEMMSQTGGFKVGAIEKLDSRALELPYDGNDVKMTIVLPNDGVSIYDVERDMDLEHIKKFSETSHNQTVVIRMPKFELSQAFDLGVGLHQLGIHDLFDRQKADLSGVTGNRDLHVSKVVHKAYIKVNEEGSEAAAATSVIMATKAMVRNEQFIMNRPFLFVIQHTRSGAVLFMGRMMKPSVTNGRDEL